MTVSNYRADYVKLDLIQGSKEWLDARYDHVTASNVACLYGLSPYKTALQYATELLERAEKDEPEGKQVLFQRGHAVEAAAREWCKANLGIEPVPTVIVSREVPQLLASLDGLDEERRLVFEAKFVGRDALNEIKGGKIKAHHECQIQAQLLATGFDRAVYFAMDPDGEAAVVDIKSNPAYLDEMTDKIKAFWALIKDGKLPEPSDRDVLQVTDPQLNLLAEMDAKLSAIKKEYDALEEIVLARYADTPRVQGGGVSITKYWAKGTVDWSALAKAKRIAQEEQDRYRKAGSLRTKVTVKRGA